MYKQVFLCKLAISVTVGSTLFANFTVEQSFKFLTPRFLHQGNKEAELNDPTGLD